MCKALKPSGKTLLHMGEALKPSGKTLLHIYKTLLPVFQNGVLLQEDCSIL